MFQYGEEQVLSTCRRRFLELLNTGKLHMADAMSAEELAEELCSQGLSIHSCVRNTSVQIGRQLDLCPLTLFREYTSMLYGIS